MHTFFLIFLFLVIVVSLAWGLWRQKRPVSVAKKAMYKKLEERAQNGDQKAIYRLAELFYVDHDERFFPLIFKWVSILASQKKDPAVWLLMGDLYNQGAGTVRDAKRALNCYEQALSADIVSGRNTDLTPESHNYLEQQIILLRQEVYK